MPSSQLADVFLMKVSPINIQFYLRSKGWKRTTRVEDKMAVYTHPNRGNTEIIVPLGTYFLDYTQRIFDAITTLSESEHREPKEILSDLLIQSPSDIVDFKISGVETEDGTIPLDTGIDLFKGAWRVLASSANAVVKPREYYPRLSTLEAEVFLKSCRIGQTERGSFAARFVCPFALPYQKLIDAEVQTSFTRRVTTMMANSIHTIAQSIEDDSIDEMLQKNKTNPIVSANLCEAIVDMQPEHAESSLDVSVSWAGEISGELQKIAAQHLPKEYFPRIEEIANKLMPKEEDSNRQFIGQIFELKKGGPTLEMPTEGEVYILFQDEDVLKKAKLTLSGEDHRRACDAYRDGLFIRVEGKLLRHARVSTIDEPENFTIIKK